MKLYQYTSSDTSGLSTQNCKLRINPEVVSGKEIFSNHLNHQLPHKQSSSGTVYIEEHLFAQIPKIQNTLCTLGIRIKGLSIKRAYNKYNLTS